MSAWEKKLGLIVPSWNTVNEYEFQCLLGSDLSLHSMRLAITADDEENFRRMATEVAGAAQLLAQAKVDVICYGCLAGGFVTGPGHDRAIESEIMSTTGIPGVAAAAAVIDAFRALRIRRVSVASPYGDWLNRKLEDYLTASGIEVMAIKGLGTEMHAKFSPQENAELAASVDRPESQAVFISCSNFRTLEVISLLEQRLGKPVLTSNMCSLWKMLRVLGDKRAFDCAGQLFRAA